MPGSRAALSVVLITLDCADTLAHCLDSVAWAEEIVIADSGSVDGTVELARSRGARVVHQAWLGFGKQKQFAVEQATHDWVLCLDTDERVTPALRASIEQALSDPSQHAYEFPRCNRFLGRYLRHGEGYPDLSLRLFHRSHARWSEDVVHEKVITLGTVGRLEGDLLHESAETLDSYLAKQNRYTTLAAEELVGQGGGVSRLQMLLSPLFRFVKFYVFRLGFLDGLPGLVHIAIGCFNSFCKYAKMIEIQRRRGYS
jgi:glycosyltransferase involved in cell wall biosynthesis